MLDLIVRVIIIFLKNLSLIIFKIFFIKKLLGNNFEIVKNILSKRILVNFLFEKIKTQDTEIIIILLNFLTINFLTLLVII